MAQTISFMDSIHRSSETRTGIGRFKLLGIPKLTLTLCGEKGDSRVFELAFHHAHHGSAEKGTADYETEGLRAKVCALRTNPRLADLDRLATPRCTA